MSLYGMGGGDAVNFTDPFGLCPRCVFAGVRGGAAAGGVVGTVVPGVGTVAGTIVGGIAGGVGAFVIWKSARDALGSRRSTNDLDLSGPPGVVTKPGSVGRIYEGGATRTDDIPGHGIEGPHTHIFVKGPNGKLNKVGQPRPATAAEIEEVRKTREPTETKPPESQR